MEGEYPENPTAYVDNIVLKSYQAMKEAGVVPQIDDSLVITTTALHKGDFWNRASILWDYKIITKKIKS